MTRAKRGFTIVEIVLFLGVTSLLMAGIIAGTSASVARQRYNDSVNSFTEFLRNVYSEVMNVQNIRTSSAEANAKCSIASTTDASNRNPGRSECVIYGKLVTFGEQNAETIHVYDVIGNTLEKSHTTSQYNFNVNNQAVNKVIQSLKDAKADVLSVNSSSRVTYAAGHYTYTPEWQARIETPNPVGSNGEGTKFNGAILIVRSPTSGTIHTFTSTTAMAPSTLISTDASSSNANTLTSRFNNFSPNRMDFCINSSDIYAAGNRRRNVRIALDGNTTSSVKLIPVDESSATGGNVCQ